MRVITLLVGYPSSGKTTYCAKHIPSSHVRISLDDELEEIMRTCDITYHEAFSTYVKQANREKEIKFAKALDDGTSIVVDMTNVSVKARRRVLNKAKSSRHEYLIRCVWLKTDVDECKRRSKIREAATGKHIPERVFGSMAFAFEEPTFAEGYGVIIEKE